MTVIYQLCPKCAAASSRTSAGQNCCENERRTRERHENRNTKDTKRTPSQDSHEARKTGDTRRTPSQDSHEARKTGDTRRTPSRDSHEARKTGDTRRTPSQDSHETRRTHETEKKEETKKTEPRHSRESKKPENAYRGPPQDVHEGRKTEEFKKTEKQDECCDGSEYTSETGSYSCSSNMERSDKIRRGQPRMYKIYPNVIMVMRHTERLDDFFPDWLSRSSKGYKPFDLNMPMSLPIKRPLQAYRNDPPFTNTGDILARIIARGMYSTAYVPDLIYCSPALRCLQTAKAVKEICKCGAKIRVEPGLFESLTLYPNGMPDFATPQERAQFNVDENYKPSTKVEDLLNKKVESNAEFNTRVRKALKRITGMHEISSTKKDQLVLIVAHASTVDLAAGHLAMRKRNSSDVDLCGNKPKIPYGSLLVMERIEGRHGWTPNLHAIPPVNYRGLSTQFDNKFVLRDVACSAAQS